MSVLSVDARLLATERGEAPRINSAAAIFASALMAAGALALANQYTWRQGALFLLGGALGLVLYHALFGFTSAWRVFIANGRGAGLRAQMVMLAVVVLLFFPVLAQGSLFGGADSSGMITSLLPLILIVVIMYFLVLRPQQQRAKQHRDMVKALRRGDSVVTNGGLVGKVTKVVDDDQIEVEIADGVRVRQMRSMVSEVRAKGEPVKDDS